MEDKRTDEQTSAQGGASQPSAPVRWPEVVHRAEPSVEKLVAIGCAIVLSTFAITIVCAIVRPLLMHR